LPETKSASIKPFQGKSAVAVARQFSGRKKNFNEESFWAEATRFQPWDLKKHKSGAISKARNNWKDKAFLMMGRFE
jgi:hypothetical protein